MRKLRSYLEFAPSLSHASEAELCSVRLSLAPCFRLFNFPQPSAVHHASFPQFLMLIVNVFLFRVLALPSLVFPTCPPSPWNPDSTSGRTTTATWPTMTSKIRTFLEFPCLDTNTFQFLKPSCWTPLFRPSSTPTMAMIMIITTLNIFCSSLR